MKNLDKMVFLHILTMIVLIKFDFEQYKFTFLMAIFWILKILDLIFLNGYIINLNV